MGTGARPPEDPDVPATFVGRADELDRLAARLARAAEGRPATLLVRGEVGVGKSRLLEEFVRRAERHRAWVLRGYCIALGRGEIPYAPLVEALRRLVRTVGHERVRTLAGAAYPVLAGLISDFTDDGSGAPAPPGPSDQSRVFGAVLRLLDELADEGPVVLIIEDLQWADRSTLDLLAYLARTLSSERLLFIGSYRTTDLPPDHPLQTLVPELELARRAEPLEVPPFGRAELRTFLRSRLSTEVGHDLVERAAELSDGNAFYVEELLTAGVLTADDGTVPVPRTVRDLVRSQVMRLGEDARELMRVAATAGRRVSHRLLAAVCDLPEDRLLAAVQDCVDSQMLVPGEADDTYAFRHALLREVVHHDLLPARRRPLHQAIAEALAGDSQLSYAAGLTVAAELSYHWHEAGAHAPALAAAVRAGADAVRLLAFRDAERQYARALAVWPRVDAATEVAGVPRARLLISAADAARWAGRVDRAVDLARSAVSDVDAAREPGLAGELYERLASYLWEAGDVDGSERAYAEAEQLLRDEPPSAAAARVRAVKASKLVREGHHAEGLTVGESALELARSVGAEPEQGRALNWIGVALAMRGRVDDGVRALREAIGLADATNQLEDLVRAFGNLAYVLEISGRLDEAVAVALQGLDRIRQTGVEHTRGAAVLANNMAAALVQRGRWDEAAGIITELLADRPVAETLFARLTLAEALVGGGRFDEVHRLLAEVRGAGVSVRQPQFLASLSASEAEIAIWQRRYEAARSAVADGLSATDGTEHTIARLRLCALGLRNEADELLRRRLLPGTARPDLATVRSAIESLTGEAERISDPAGGPVLPEVTALQRLCRAEAARAENPAPDRARTTDQVRTTDRGRVADWSELADAWESLSRPYQAAYARWRDAEQAPRDRSTASARAAHRLAESLGAEPLRAEILAHARGARLDLEPDRPEPATEAADVGGPAPAANPYQLTERERDVLALLSAGQTNPQIAAKLVISRRTVTTHVSHILTKMGVTTRGEAAAVAHRLGLVDEPPAG